ncbi:MAG: peptide deformylase [Parcubacteria group bacterium CG1_02_41_12]|nr:MAG: peptide deformylase [Parcubacteria group bacterium CG1_02_41_12]PIP67302.1 MAG: peptide deformylase [Parcubacteria group bacterium CG22_combo_CG10-13_8_21_14_all_41_9]PIR56820.1 MAG: peptide deformylase [Parcubacteria group bacterium CG10_big_fil_rev_8_21_14_0_10_41_35]
MKLKIITHPNDILRKTSARVDDINAVQKLCSDMVDTMEQEKGIGLSAVQVGDLVRIIAIHKDADKSLEDHAVMINPKIFSKSKDLEEGEEGCLSIPNCEGIVKRAKKIKVRYTDVSGLEQKTKAVGLFARVIQHEIDHLDGILFIDKTEKLTKGF